VTTILPGELQTGAHYHTVFRGHQRDEFNWFATGESLPVGSISAERAAREIVDATRRGESERVLSLAANVFALLHGVIPGAVTDALGLINRYVLPPANPEDTGRATGEEVQRREPQPLRDAVLSPGACDAERLNQFSDSEAAGGTDITER
jgi:hypothetical protein